MSNYKIGILYGDGKFSLHRKEELMGSEGLYIKQVLLNQPEIDEVDILTTDAGQVADKIICSEKDLDYYTDIILFWSSTNQWGGELAISQYKVYKFLHTFKGNIYYWFEDMRFPLMELTHIIQNRPFWTNNPLCELSELTLPKQINFISMFEDPDIVYKAHSNIDIKQIYKCPLYLTHDDSRPVKQPLFGKSIDLIYGGFGRSQKRNAFYKEYFFNQSDIVVELYGTVEKDIKDLNVGNCIVSPRVPYNQVLSKNATALSTIIPAEKGYNNNCITPRLIEALLSGCICFIQNEFDTEHNILVDDFFYVNSGDELKHKIIQLKSNMEFYNSKLTHQNAVLRKLRAKDLGKILVNIVDKNHNM